jgi:hypothetical protein
MLAGCSSGNAKNGKATKESSSISSSEKKNEMKASITLFKEKEEIASKEFDVKEGDNLLDALKSQFDVKEEGGMITSINGVEQDKDNNYYWTYKINDEMVNTGAKDTILKEGDKVVFTYAKF